MARFCLEICQLQQRFASLFKASIARYLRLSIYINYMRESNFRGFVQMFISSISVHCRKPSTNLLLVYTVEPCIFRYCFNPDILDSPSNALQLLSFSPQYRSWNGLEQDEKKLARKCISHQFRQRQKKE